MVRSPPGYTSSTLGHEQHVDALGGGLRTVAVEVARVGGEVLGGRELRGVHEQADDDEIVLGRRRTSANGGRRGSSPIVGTNPTVRPWAAPRRRSSRSSATVVTVLIAHRLRHGRLLPGAARAWPGPGCRRAREAQRLGGEGAIGTLLVGGERAEMAGDGVGVARNRAGERGLGPRQFDVVERGAHQRQERLGRDPGIGGDACRLAEERDEVVRGDGGRHVVGRRAVRRGRGRGASRGTTRGVPPRRGRRPRTTSRAGARRRPRPTAGSAAGAANRRARRGGRWRACRARRACRHPTGAPRACRARPPARAPRPCPRSRRREWPRSPARCRRARPR